MLLEYWIGSGIVYFGLCCLAFVSWYLQSSMHASLGLIPLAYPVDVSYDGYALLLEMLEEYITDNWDENSESQLVSKTFEKFTKMINAQLKMLKVAKLQIILSKTDEKKEYDDFLKKHGVRLEHLKCTSYKDVLRYYMLYLQGIDKFFFEDFSTRLNQVMLKEKIDRDIRAFPNFKFKDKIVKPTFSPCDIILCDDFGHFFEVILKAIRTINEKIVYIRTTNFLHLNKPMTMLQQFDCIVQQLTAKQGIESFMKYCEVLAEVGVYFDISFDESEHKRCEKMFLEEIVNKFEFSKTAIRDIQRKVSKLFLAILDGYNSVIFTFNSVRYRDKIQEKFRIVITDIKIKTTELINFLQNKSRNVIASNSSNSKINMSETFLTVLENLLSEQTNTDNSFLAEHTDTEEKFTKKKIDKAKSTYIIEDESTSQLVINSKVAIIVGIARYIF